MFPTLRPHGELEPQWFPKHSEEFESNLDALEREEQAYNSKLRAIANVAAPEPIGKNISLQPPTPLSSRRHVRMTPRSNRSNRSSRNSNTSRHHHTPSTPSNHHHHQRRRRRHHDETTTNDSTTSSSDRYFQYEYRRPSNIDTASVMESSSHDGRGHVEL